MKILKRRPFENFVAKTKEEAISHWVNVVVDNRPHYPPRPGSIGRRLIRLAVKRIRMLLATFAWEDVYNKELMEESK